MQLVNKECDERNRLIEAEEEANVGADTEKGVDMENGMGVEARVDKNTDTDILARGMGKKTKFR